MGNLLATIGRPAARTILQFCKIVYSVSCELSGKPLASKAPIDLFQEVPMTLASLLEKASTASPADRIEWRDQIAAFGPRAIEGVRPWLSNPALAGFAIRVIERVGAAGDPALAAQVLRAARTRVPPAVSGDIAWALQRLRDVSKARRTEHASPIVPQPQP